MTAASAAHASPAKTAILDSAIPSSHTVVSPRESTQAMRVTCSRNADHDARPADCFKRLNAVVRDGPTTSSRASRRPSSVRDSRPVFRSNTSVFTSPPELGGHGVQCGEARQLQ